ncbi:MAG: hypothetical protein K2Z25_07855 [Beijerinckiaceae bacterium]|nr:hypothetical protein [Beijerinckiaceae bacterium]
MKLLTALAVLMAVSLGAPSSGHAQGILQELLDIQHSMERRATEQRADRVMPDHCSDPAYPCKKQLLEGGWIIKLRGEDHRVIDAEHEVTILVKDSAYKFCLASVHPYNKTQLPCLDLHVASN